MSGPNLDNYVDVAARIRDFRDKYPEGSLQQIDLQFVEVAGKSWVVYTAAAYRDREDARPGHGTAWEPIPGPTAFTRDSEVQNAETSAWGRAIIAVGAADASRIASREEVQNRTGDGADLSPQLRLIDALSESGFTLGVQKDIIGAAIGRTSFKSVGDLSNEECEKALTALDSAIADRDQLAGES